MKKKIEKWARRIYFSFRSRGRGQRQPHIKDWKSKLLSAKVKKEAPLPLPPPLTHLWEINCGHETRAKTKLEQKPFKTRGPLAESNNN